VAASSRQQGRRTSRAQHPITNTRNTVGGSLRRCHFPPNVETLNVSTCRDYWTAGVLLLMVALLLALLLTSTSRSPRTGRIESEIGSRDVLFGWFDGLMEILHFLRHIMVQQFPIHAYRLMGVSPSLLMCSCRTRCGSLEQSCRLEIACVTNHNRAVMTKIFNMSH
jgi:hypothetical protein